MKKIIYSILAIAALAACNKGVAPEQNVTPAEPKGFVITVGTDSKASFNEEDYSVSWKENEELRVFINGEAYTFVRVGETDQFACENFTPVEGTEYHYEVLTPYRSDWGDLVFSYSGAASDPKMYGSANTVGSEAPSITMNHLTAVIKTTIKNVGITDLKITSIRIESDSQIIGGRHKITNGAPVAVNPVTYTEMNDQDISIPAGGEKNMYLTCMPFNSLENETLKFTIKTACDVFFATKTLTSTVHFVAGKVNTTTVNVNRTVPSATNANTVYVDFGGEKTSDTTWNTYNKRGTTETDYVDLNNAEWTNSGLKMTTKASFDGSGWNDTGITKTWTENGLTYPNLVWRDAMLAKTNAGKLEISGCDVNSKYTIETLHIRYNGSRGPRVFNITMNGTTINNFDCGMPANTAEGTNVYSIVYHDIAPDADGKINITITPLLGSNGTTKEATINAMVITKQ